MAGVIELAPPVTAEPAEPAEPAELIGSPPSLVVELHAERTSPARGNPQRPARRPNRAPRFSLSIAFKLRSKTGGLRSRLGRFVPTQCPAGSDFVAVFAPAGLKKGPGHGSVTHGKNPTIGGKSRTELLQSRPR
jgi:hypothetical protein